MKRAFWLTVFVGFALGFLFVLSAGCATVPRTRAERARDEEIRARRQVEIGAAQTYSMTRRATVCSPIAEIGARWAIERAQAECVAGGLKPDCYVGDVLLTEGATDHRRCR